VDIAERFAENLLRLRQATKMSQEELAFRASIHRTQISLMESGSRQPRLDTLVKLAGALEVPVESLLKGISWEPSVTKVGHFRVAD
jgi:XRE family transcriptional regulator, regulator of sulfur utilization